MSDDVTAPHSETLVFEFDLEAGPETVWRAISREEHRREWLASDAPLDSDLISERPGREVSYRMREDEPPFLESVVTFQICPKQSGGTSLRIIHEIADRWHDRTVKAANGNGPALMIAA